MSKEVGEMVRSRDVVQAEGSARTEGARRATGVRADGAAAGAGALAPGQRWSASRKRDVVLRLLRGEWRRCPVRRWRRPRGLGLKGSSRRVWRRVAGAGRWLDALTRNVRRVCQWQVLGALRGERAHRLELSHAPRANTRDRIRHLVVCDARRARAHHRWVRALLAIRTDLARSPFHGEGHRKVHARRILDGIACPPAGAARHAGARTLSPHRGRQGAAKTHDGRVITQAPNVMWGTDGVRVARRLGLDLRSSRTLERGVRGVARVQSREPLRGDPIAQGLERRYARCADVARGLALRRITVSLSDHFLKQIRYWGIHPSFGFVEEPETNGVAERWNRTLKEQAIHGRIFQNLAAVRAAVADFVERYWRLEKLGYTRRCARSMSYARRHSVCPGNRVRYSDTMFFA